MLFNSFHFILFFIAVVILYYMSPHKFRWILLLIASYYFYICWRPKQIIFILLIVFSTFINYIFSLIMYREKNDKKRKKYLIITLMINFSLLFLFKYSVFVNETIMAVCSKFVEWYYSNLGKEEAFAKVQMFLEQYPAKDFDIILPMGISFYTFQATSYSIDVYRNKIKPVRHYGIFSLFITFFPQLVAGPIERSSNLLPQFYKKHKFHKQNVLIGLKWMLWGFFKKIVIADRASTAVNTIYNNVGSYNGFYFVFATILFAFQIYCDFSGYSNIALGSAKVLGFDLIHNFDKPYLSKSIKELWRRWHVSLSTWFMDYIYIPLGGNKKGTIRKCVNLFITFFVSGIWHGANWTFAIWGALHGIYLVMGVLIEKVIKRIMRVLHLEHNIIWNFCSIITTFLLFSISLIIFRANTITDAIYIFRHLLDDVGQWTSIQYIYEIITSMGINLYELIIIVLSILFLMFAEIATGKYHVIDGIEKRNYVVRMAFYVFVSVWVLSNGVFSNSGEFIYFQF